MEKKSKKHLKSKKTDKSKSTIVKNEGSSKSAPSLTGIIETKSPKPKTNPNKVNQHTAEDPRQILFLAYYFDTQSDTFANARQSALKAGYSENYADNITDLMPAWLLDSIGEFRRKNMLEKAERNLERELDMSVQAPIENPINGQIARDEEGNPICKTDIDLLKIQHDASKFVAERLGKDHYSTRSEQTGANGGAIILETYDYSNADPDDTSPGPGKTPGDTGSKNSK